MRELIERQSHWEKKTSPEPRMKSPVVRFSAMGLMICSVWICFSLSTSRSVRNVASLSTLTLEHLHTLGAFQKPTK